MDHLMLVNQLRPQIKPSIAAIEEQHCIMMPLIRNRTENQLYGRNTQKCELLGNYNTIDQDDFAAAHRFC